MLIRSFLVTAVMSVGGAFAWGAASAQPTSFEGWRVVTENDRFTGRTDFFLRSGRPGTSIVISYSHQCDNCQPWHHYGLSIFFDRQLACPFQSTDDYDMKFGRSERADVRWVIDDGVIHRQEYVLHQGNSAIYDWQVLQTQPSEIRSTYMSSLEASGAPSHHIPANPDRVLPLHYFVEQLANGTTLYARISDRCQSVDVEFDLSGFKAALGSV